MDEDKKPREERRRNRPGDHRNDVELAPMQKDGEKLLEALNNGKMVAVLSGLEIMYVFILRSQYQCFIHKMDAEEGRRKAWVMSQRNTAMIKNLASVCDGLFEIGMKPDMNPMGVMVAAEKGIIAYLDMTGNLPAEDMDFMSWQEQMDDTDK